MYWISGDLLSLFPWERCFWVSSHEFSCSKPALKEESWHILPCSPSLWILASSWEHLLSTLLEPCPPFEEVISASHKIETSYCVSIHSRIPFLICYCVDLIPAEPYRIYLMSLYSFFIKKNSNAISIFLMSYLLWPSLSKAKESTGRVCIITLNEWIFLLLNQQPESYPVFCPLKAKSIFGNPLPAFLRTRNVPSLGSKGLSIFYSKHVWTPIYSWSIKCSIYIPM